MRTETESESHVAPDLDSDVLTLVQRDSQVVRHKLSDAHRTINQFSPAFLVLKAKYNFPTQLSVGVADKFLGLIKYLPFQSFTQANSPSRGLPLLTKS